MRIQLNLHVGTLNFLHKNEEGQSTFDMRKYFM